MLRGSLEEFALSDIFLLIAGARKTGRLEISRRAGSGGVYFRNGEIYFAESSLTREPLGQKLVRAGVLRERDLMKALDEHAASGMRVGEVLVRNGAIDKSQLAVAIRSQVQDAASDCLKWEVGEFEFESSSEVVAEIPIRVTVDYVIMEASRLLDDVAGTERKLRSRKMVLRRVADVTEAKTNLRLSTGEERIFLLIDGERPVSEILAEADDDELVVLRTLHGLLSCGMIEVVPAAASEPEPLAYAVDPVKAAAAVSAAVEESGSSSDVPAVQPPVDAGAVEVEEAPPPTGEIEIDVTSGSEIEIVSAEPQTPSGDVSITEDDPTPPPRSEAEAEAEISANAATPAPAPPAPKVEAPLPFEEWFEDPDLKKDPVMPEGAEDAPRSVAAEIALESARVQPPQPPATEVNKTPAFEVREAPAAELREPSGRPFSMRIDRAVVVRELASLFSEDETPSPAQRAAKTPEGTQIPKQLEGDDDLDRGLIDRLIEGVEGL